MPEEHELVVLIDSVPTEGLEAGDVGTIVPYCPDGKAFEVEFVVVTLESARFRPVTRRDMMPTRAMQVV
jgi:hypothetical protein